MPYLRLTRAQLERDLRVRIATRLTEAINQLFYQDRGRLTREELRERTTVHFAPCSEVISSSVRGLLISEGRRMSRSNFPTGRCPCGTGAGSHGNSHRVGEVVRHPVSES